jgi:hypothetical protein
MSLTNRVALGLHDYHKLTYVLVMQVSHNNVGRDSMGETTFYLTDADRILLDELVFKFKINRSVLVRMFIYEYLIPRFKDKLSVDLEDYVKIGEKKLKKQMSRCKSHDRMNYEFWAGNIRNLIIMTVQKYKQIPSQTLVEHWIRDGEIEGYTREEAKKYIQSAIEDAKSLVLGKKDNRNFVIRMDGKVKKISNKIKRIKS